MAEMKEQLQEEVRQCMRPGQTMTDIVSPGFASIVISRKQLDER